MHSAFFATLNIQGLDCSRKKNKQGVLKTWFFEKKTMEIPDKAKLHPILQNCVYTHPVGKFQAKPNKSKPNKYPYP